MNGTKPLPIKHHSLTGRITTKLMHEAFLAVKKNRGAAGVDRQSIKMFEANLEQNLEALMRQLKGRSFRPKPARRTYIDKGGGRKRPLGIPTFEDKLLQRAVLMLLEPIYEQEFHDCSYGFRPGRSTHQAIATTWKHTMDLRGGFVLEVDLRKFFDQSS